MRIPRYETPKPPFWDGARAGHFGDKLKSYADNGQRQQVQRWVTANDAAAKLLGPDVTRVTPDLPIEVATARTTSPLRGDSQNNIDPSDRRERGMGQWGHRSSSYREDVAACCVIKIGYFTSI